jgi:hypothetical protein
VRPLPIRLPATLLALPLLLCGCSKRAERIVGNERLIRGPAGVGTTAVQTSTPDRDTYVTPGTANYGPVLLVGSNSSGFEARSFFKSLKFNLPDTTLPGFTPGNILFDLPQSGVLRIPPSHLSVRFGGVSSSLVDSGTIAWPGPSITTPLASKDYQGEARLVLDLGPAFNQFKGWALDPSSAPAFVLEATTRDTVAAFQAGAARFRAVYSWNRQGTAVYDTVNSTAALDLYLHSPLNPPPTGAETALQLGGPFEPSVAIRAPVPAIGSGVSVNELRFVLPVLGTIPAVDRSVVYDSSYFINVYRITGDWPEGATDLSAVPYNTTPIAIISGKNAPAADTLSVPLPTSIARSWFQDPASNYGVLLTVRSANVNAGLLLGSRESPTPPVLRLSTTTPPPGRF